MADEEKRILKRSPAVKVSIRDILTGSFIKEEGGQPNHLRTVYGERVARANIVSSVLDKNTSPNESSIIVDDSTGKLFVRSFENSAIFDNIGIGELIIIVGRPREFNGEIYLSAEIVKKLDSVVWADLRKLELQNKISKVMSSVAAPAEEPVKDKKEYMGANTINNTSGAKKAIELIRKMDKGEGVEMKGIMEKCGNEFIKEDISFLIKRGEVFEIRPGVLKLLE